jgi:hypothetical protein
MTETNDAYTELLPETRSATLRQNTCLVVGLLLAIAGMVSYGVATRLLVIESFAVATFPHLFTASILLLGFGGGLFVMMFNNIAGVVTAPTLWKVSSVYVPLVLLYGAASMKSADGFDPVVAFVHLCFMCGAGILWAFWRTRSLNPLSRSY